MNQSSYIDLFPAQPKSGHPMLAGIFCGIGAGALWALVFLVPQIAKDFGPLELAIGRYVAYGLISLALLAPRWKNLLPRVRRGDWITLCWLGLSGNTLYYIMLSGAVQLGGIAMTSLIIGFLPVAVTIIGSRHRGAVPLGRLAPSLILCSLGALCIGWQVLTTPVSGSILRQVGGVVCAIGALASWTCFVVGNRRVLSRIEGISAQEWNYLMGIVTGAQTLFLVPVAVILGHSSHEFDKWATLAGISLAVGFFASIMGNALWNRMSTLLPLSLVGQMILFETLFALIYAFLWEGRLPIWSETLAFGFVTGSVISCISAHQRWHRRGS